MKKRLDILMVERGLADSDAGRVISNDEMARLIHS